MSGRTNVAFSNEVGQMSGRTNVHVRQMSCLYTGRTNVAILALGRTNVVVGRSDKCRSDKRRSDKSCVINKWTLPNDSEKISERVILSFCAQETIYRCDRKIGS